MRQVGHGLPQPGPPVGRVRHELALRRHDQRPRQLGRRGGRADAFGDGDPQLGGGGHVDVAADLAGLRNQFQIGQLGQQRAGKFGALAYQHQRLERRQPRRQLAHAPAGIVEYFDIMAVQQTEAVQAAGGVLVVVENCYLHNCASDFDRVS
ncbi:hypothetical protein D9M69_599230 [compost metagenome]